MKRYINQQDSSAFITIEQASILIQYSQATIRRWIREGKLKGYRIGCYNHYRLKKGEVFARMVDIAPE